MEKQTYDILAYIGRICLPALAVFYGVIAKIWSLPYAMEIPATISAIAVLINSLLKKESDEYFKDKEV